MTLPRLEEIQACARLPAEGGKRALALRVAVVERVQDAGVPPKSVALPATLDPRLGRRKALPPRVHASPPSGHFSGTATTARIVSAVGMIDRCRACGRSAGQKLTSPVL